MNLCAASDEVTPVELFGISLLSKQGPVHNLCALLPLVQLPFSALKALPLPACLICNGIRPPKSSLQADLHVGTFRYKFGDAKDVQSEHLHHQIWR